VMVRSANRFNRCRVSGSKLEAANQAVWVQGEPSLRTNLVFSNVRDCKDSKVWATASTASRSDLYQLLIPPDAD
jgi:hypothetical protein